MTVTGRPRQVRPALVCLALGIGGAPNAAAGQSELGAIEGMVLDIAGLVPISRAVVVLNGGVYQTLTNAGGEYVLDSLAPGEYEIRVRRIGYQEVVAEGVTIEPGKRERMDFALEKGAISLEDIQVTAGERNTPDATRSSSVLRSEDLPDQGEILNVLQGRIPGLRVSGANDDMRVRLRGGVAEPMFVINGVVARPPLRFYIGSSEVECVEVRRGQQAVLEFRGSSRTDVYNGVILIWTKDSGRHMTGACSR